MVDWWRRVGAREVLGVSADILGVVGSATIVGPLVVGLVVGQLVPAVVTALVLSLLVALYLARRERHLNERVRQLTSDLMETAGRTGIVERSSDRLQARLVAQHGVAELIAELGPNVRELARSEFPNAAPTPEAGATRDAQWSDEPSSWLARAHDLRTFGVTAADFEMCVARAIERTVGEVGPDADVIMGDSLLFLDVPRLLSGTPYLTFILYGRQSLKSATVTFKGSLERMSMLTAPISRYPPLLRVPRRPWFDDADFGALIRSSWLRMQPFNGAVVLQARKASPTAPSPWLVQYVSLAGQAAGRARGFRMTEGSLVEVEDL